MPKAMSLSIIIKHAGSSHELTIDLAQPGRALKQQIYEATGVPIDRMKVMIKGGMLKDDADLAKLAFKPKQQIMVIGTAGPLPERPKTETVFLEDMDDGELALATRTPAGLVNLGNTCYFAASAQALRSIPSLNESLSTFTPSAATSGSSGSGGSPQLAGALKHLFNGMAQTTEGYAPHHFLGALRQVAPQFAEMGRGGGGYAQQDADECWTTMTNALRAVPGSTTGKSWVEENMMGSMVKELTCDEAPDETPTRLTEAVPKLDCNISITTNYLHQGILASLDQKIEKNSPTLGRTAVYTQKSRLERLPDVLTVHLVRFYWRRDTNSKAKIMRRVKFPHEYDVLDLCTDDLRKRLSPVNAALKQVAKDREERARIRKRARTAANTNTAAAVGAAQADSATDSAAPAASATEGAESVEVYTGTPEEEAAKLAEERSKLASLIDANLRSDKGANKSGLYELAAIVTHKGASADSGHYIGWVKKQAAASASDPSTVHPVGPVSEADEEWHKFDDDKVSIVGRDKIGSLEGGGEDSAAYILVYRSKPLE